MYMYITKRRKWIQSRCGEFIEHIQDPEFSSQDHKSKKMLRRPKFFIQELQ